MPREVVGVGGRRFAARPGLSIDGCAGRAASGAAAAAGRSSVAAGGRAAAPGRVQVDDAPALDAVGASWKDSGVQVGCPKTPVKGKMPSKGSRRVGPTEVPAMRKPNPTPLSRTRTIDALPAMGKKKHHENFTGCTRRPCSKRRRGTCPSSPARSRSSPRSARSRRRPRITRSTRPATCTAPTRVRYAL